MRTNLAWSPAPTAGKCHGAPRAAEEQRSPRLSRPARHWAASRPSGPLLAAALLSMSRALAPERPLHVSVTPEQCRPACCDWTRGSSTCQVPAASAHRQDEAMSLALTRAQFRPPRRIESREDRARNAPGPPAAAVKEYHPIYK